MLHRVRRRHRLFLACLGSALACAPPPSPGPASPSILLVTLDTTRADAVESAGLSTPHLDALAERGVRFAQAYATAPMTLPSHASMLTGLDPAEHGLHENARYLDRGRLLLAERLRERGYTSAAFVSGLPLGGEFGLARGFDLYDDAFPEDAAERRADATTDRALAWLEGAPERPLFVWVHYFDPHDPYEPPEPFASRHADDLYLGEIAFADEQLGRLLAAFEEATADDPSAIVVAGDHGEGRGDHGEAFHGNLLYQGVMRVPLVVAGSEIAPRTVAAPVSVRQIFATVSRWAGYEEQGSLLDEPSGPVLAEAMQPFLQYGWQPQVMAVAGTTKVIRAGGLEVYDVLADPSESENLVGRRELDPALRAAVRDYPLPTPGAIAEAQRLSQETKERLASLGYVSSAVPPVLRGDAPRPADMTDLFPVLDRASGLFVRGEYADALPLFARILERDPGNLAAALRLAVAHSSLGHDRAALAAFERARRISPASIDVRHYLAMHLLRSGRLDDAGPLLESVLAESPDRLPTLAALARVRAEQGRIEEARDLLQRVVRFKPSATAELVLLGELSMAVGDTPAAIRAFEDARDLLGDDFGHHLELGVCYLAERRLEAARAALDRVPPEHPGYAMALFKRAQVSVLLGEPDRAEWIRRAEEAADEITGPLIERETLFRDLHRR